MWRRECILLQTQQMQTLSALAWLAQHLHWGRRQKQCALLCDRGASIQPTCHLSTSTFAGRTRSFLNFEETSRLSRVKPSACSASDSRHISLGSGGRPSVDGFLHSPPYISYLQPPSHRHFCLFYGRFPLSLHLQPPYPLALIAALSSISSHLMINLDCLHFSSFPIVFSKLKPILLPSSFVKMFAIRWQKHWNIKSTCTTLTRVSWVLNQRRIRP